MCHAYRTHVPRNLKTKSPRTKPSEKTKKRGGRKRPGVWYGKTENEANIKQLYPPTPWNGTWKACDIVTPSFGSLILPLLECHFGCTHFDASCSKSAQKWFQKRGRIQTRFWMHLDSDLKQFVVPKSLQNRYQIRICFKISVQVDFRFQTQGSMYFRED